MQGPWVGSAQFVGTVGNRFVWNTEIRGRSGGYECGGEVGFYSKGSGEPRQSLELGMASTTAFVPGTLGLSWGTADAGVPRVDASAHVSPETGCPAPHVLPRPFKSPRAT